MISLSFRGLAIEGRAEYDPGVRYHPDGSGDPPLWDVEIHVVEIDDWEKFSLCGLLSDFSDGIQRMLAAYHRISKGKLLPALETIIVQEWYDDIIEALVEAS